MLVTIHQPEFLPWLGFFDKVRRANTCVLLDHVQFRKNYFQNRNRIRTPVAQGWSYLTVPVLTTGRFGQAICDVPINNAVNWRRQHLTSLQQHYHSSPEFQAHFQRLQDIYQRDWELLADLNVELIIWLAAMLGLGTSFVRSSQIGVEGSRSSMLLDICQKLGATEYLSGISGGEYLEQDLFDGAGIVVHFQEFYHPIYRQTYEPFVPGLSATDLLFNHGEHSLEILAGEDTPRLSTIFE